MKNILSIQSHVVFGHAGNSAAEFPMRRMGVNVWPLNTVQFSNHTQYGQWTGCVMPASHLSEIAQGIAKIDQLKRCDAVLSGYIGSPEQGDHILAIVRQVKQANPNAWYFCDPVMGHPEKGCIVA
ncbi:pyridoxal kinase, partial [uncultured Serratia sp.]|uniref:pyridoxal kinase n=1 Tax=uncultured Serratia sp. TaxID=239175 RepID=UPI00259302CD